MNRASSNRTMITQRAKLRRLAFIERSLPAAPTRGGVSFLPGPGGEFASVPFTNVGSAGPHGKGPKSDILARFSWPWLYCVGAWLRFCHAARGARSIISVLPPASVTMAPARAAAKTRIVAGLGGIERGFQRLQLGELHRPLVAHLVERPAEQAQARSRQAVGQSRRRRKRRYRRRRRDDKLGHAPAPTAASIAASARRSRRASSASRRASSPSCASAGISSRSRARVKRGSRLEGSSANGIFAALKVAIRPRLGDVEQRADKLDRPAVARQRATAAPSPRAPSPRCRASCGSARSRPGRRAYAR